MNQRSISLTVVWIAVLFAIAQVSDAHGAESEHVPKGVRLLENKSFDDSESARQAILKLYKDLRKKGTGMLHDAFVGSKSVKIVDDDDLEGIDRHQNDQRGEIQPAHRGKNRPNAVINRLQKPVEAEPYLPDQRLTRIEHLKIDQPAEDDMRQNDELGDVQHHKQDLHEGCHGQAPRWAAQSVVV